MRTPKFSAPRSAGFSLVEIMVGMVIGMLAVIVMLQVFALSEGRKRTTTSGGDAQTSGALVIHQLQHDIAQAGFGFATPKLFNCRAKWKVESTGVPIVTAVPLAPATINPAVAIIPAGDLNTDTLLIMYGNGNDQPQGNVVVDRKVKVYIVLGLFAVGDQVIAKPASGCVDLTIDPVTQVDNLKVTIDTESEGATLYNLGSSPTVRAYAIRGGNLTACDYMRNDCGLDANKNNPSIWVPIASNIVSLKAQYARYTPDAPPKPPEFDQATPTTDCDWVKTSALRLAVVARSNQFEKGVVTNANALDWAGKDQNPILNATGMLGPNVALDEPWKHYRYKVSQTTVPIRNVTWMGVPTGC